MLAGASYPACLLIAPAKPDLHYRPRFSCIPVAMFDTDYCSGIFAVY